MPKNKCAEELWIEECKKSRLDVAERYVHFNGHTFYHNKYYPMRHPKGGYSRQTLDLSNSSATWVRD